MSLHRSLRSTNTLARHRNVLTRVERLDKLQDSKRWSPEEGSVFGLPKVRSMKRMARKKKKKDQAEGEEAAA